MLPQIINTERQTASYERMTWKNKRIVQKKKTVNHKEREFTTETRANQHNQHGIFNVQPYSSNKKPNNERIFVLIND